MVASSPDLIDANWDAPSGGAAEAKPSSKVSRSDDAPTSGDEWWVRTDDADVTEMATADVVFGIRAGMISASSMVWREGMVDWLGLEEVPIFRLAALGAATRSTPPPKVDTGDGPELTIGVEDESIPPPAEPAPAIESVPPPAEPAAAMVEEAPPRAPTLLGLAPVTEATPPATILEEPAPVAEATPPATMLEEPAPEEEVAEVETPVEPEQAPVRKSAPASAKPPAPKRPLSQPPEDVHTPPPRQSRPARAKPQRLRPAADAQPARPSGSPPPVPVRSRPPATRTSGSPPPVPVRSSPSSRPPGEDDVTRVKSPGMLLTARSVRESSEPTPTKPREAPRIIATRSELGRSAKQADPGDDEPALAVYSRPVPTLAFARPELTELTPDPVHPVVAPSRGPSSPSIEVRPASIAPGEVLPTSSRPPPPSAIANLPDLTDATDAAAWPSTLRPGSSRATMAIAAAAVVAAVVIGLSIRSGSRSSSQRTAAPRSAEVPAQPARPADSAPPAPRVESSASPPVEPTAVASATPSPAETETAPPPRPRPVATVTRGPEAAEPAVSPPAQRREPLAKELTNAADDSVARLGRDTAEPEEKTPSKSARHTAPSESRSGLDDPGSAKGSEPSTDEKRRVLTEPGF